MAKGKIINAYYRCQQAVIDRIGIENLNKSIRIGRKVKKVFENSYDLIDYLYKHGQRDKFIWLEQSKIELDIDVNDVKCRY